MLTKTFKKEKIESRWLYGGTKDKVKTVSDFVKKPDVRVLVANSASGATGLNLQVAHYVVFFESPVDPIIRDQAERRAWARGDSQDKVFFYDLVMAKSIENKVLSYVKEGKDLHAEIMRVRPADGRALLCRA
jgi:SNF2 family DNA or RNA helicase